MLIWQKHQNKTWTKKTIPLHLLVSCSWPYLSLKTFVEKSWSCPVNAKMLWRRYKELAPSLWSQDREWLPPPFDYHSCFVFFNLPEQINSFIWNKMSVYCQMGGIWASRICRRSVCARERRVSSLEHMDQLPKLLHLDLLQASESGQKDTRCI